MKAIWKKEVTVFIFFDICFDKIHSWHVRRRQRARQGGAGHCRAGPVGFGNEMSSSAPPQHPPHTMWVSCVHSDSLKSYHVPIWNSGTLEVQWFNIIYLSFIQQCHGALLFPEQYISVAQDRKEVYYLCNTGHLLTVKTSFINSLQQLVAVHTIQPPFFFYTDRLFSGPLCLFPDDLTLVQCDPWVSHEFRCRPPSIVYDLHLKGAWGGLFLSR